VCECVCEHCFLWKYVAPQFLSNMCDDFRNATLCATYNPAHVPAECAHVLDRSQFVACKQPLILHQQLETSSLHVYKMHETCARVAHCACETHHIFVYSLYESFVCVNGNECAILVCKVRWR
jgi:hypothetical protein